MSEPTWPGLSATERERRVGLLVGRGIANDRARELLEAHDGSVGLALRQAKSERASASDANGVGGSGSVAAEPKRRAFVARLSNLTFGYNTQAGQPPQLRGVDCHVPAGSRVLLVGANGAGKSTLLRVIAGFHRFSSMSFDEFDVNGEAKSADQYNGMAYLGGVWRRKKTGFEGMEPYSMDIAAGDMMRSWQDDYRERRDELVRVLGINLSWRMHRVSDGQRKKVRIMLKLLRPFQLCLIDEFAVELDIYARKRFMDWLCKECAERGAAVVYATHIFDQADDWATHIAFMRHDRTLSPVHELATFAPYQALLAKTGAARVYCPMYHLVLRFLEEQHRAADPNGALSVAEAQMVEPEETPERQFDAYDSGYESGRFHMRELKLKHARAEAEWLRKQAGFGAAAQEHKEQGGVAE